MNLAGVVDQVMGRAVEIGAEDFIDIGRQLRLVERFGHEFEHRSRAAASILKGMWRIRRRGCPRSMR